MFGHKTLSHQYIFIPRHSTIEVIVKDSGANVRVTVSASGASIKPPLQANHPAAWNQTWRHGLASQGEYAIIVDIDFLKSASVTAELKVLDVAGNVFGAPWEISLTELEGNFVTLSLGLGVL